MGECRFCRKEDGIIYEDGMVYVVPDENPFSYGHLLVIPKRHFESIMEMDDETLCRVMAVVKMMEKRLVEKLNVAGITLRQNWHPFLEEGMLVVRHVHFHIIPRSPNDGLYYAKERMSLGKEEKKKLVELLKM